MKKMLKIYKNNKKTNSFVTNLIVRFFTLNIFFSCQWCHNVSVH